MPPTSAVLTALRRRQADYKRRFRLAVIVMLLWPLIVQFSWNAVTPLAVLALPVSFTTYFGLLGLFVAARVFFSIYVPR